MIPAPADPSAVHAVFAALAVLYVLAFAVARWRDPPPPPPAL